MPDGMDTTTRGARKTGMPDGASGARDKGAAERKKMLVVMLAGTAAFLLFYLFFAFYLMVSLPMPDGGGGGLRAAGNLFYGAASMLAVAAFALLALRMLRGGMAPAQLQKILMRPGILLAFIVVIAVMVFVSINRQTPIPIDVIEPSNLQGLTAPVEVTFGTDSLRSILRKQGVRPLKFKWDFNGDGNVDAETTDNDVTTVYKKKGIYPVKLRILLNNGKTRSSMLRIFVPNVVFEVSPDDPIPGEDVVFDATNVINDIDKLDSIAWNFGEDGSDSVFGAQENVVTRHSFRELGVHQVRATVRYMGGLQEVFTRPVTVVSERKQPFDVGIETEGELNGTAPLGIIFNAKIENGVQPKEIKWFFGKQNSLFAEPAQKEVTGKRVSNVFSPAGTYRVKMSVTDSVGRVASKSLTVTALEPLELADVVVSGIPKPSGNTIEGRAPLEVKLSASTKTPLISFKWEQEGASRVFASEPSYHARYQKEGVYPVVLVASDADGRVQKFDFEVKVLEPKSRVIFTAMPSTGTAPLDVSFDASQSSIPGKRITGFAWMFGDEAPNEKPKLLGAHVEHRYENEGTYDVTVQALTEEGDSFEANKTIVVRLPVLNACFFPSRSIGNNPLAIRFNAGCSTGEIVKYKWTFGDGQSAERQESVIDHVFKSSGTYITTLEVLEEGGNFSQTSSEIHVK